jgi:hypothetical protein
MKSGRLLFLLACFLCLAAPVLATTRYVNLSNPAPTPPYTNWPVAATNIQDAIDASNPGDVILVTNGLYNTGSRTVIDSTPCRVVINKPVSVRSVNGPEATVIEGFALPGSFPWSPSSVRCAYLTNGAALTGFTLTNGSVRATAYVNLADLGGGAYCESTSAVLSNCVIINCAAYAGGGAHGGSFFHCLITNCVGHIGGGGVESGNLDRCEVVWGTSDNLGGGLYLCNATNCTIIDNLGIIGGGAYGGTLNQCTVFGNYAAVGALGGGYGGGVDNSLTYNCIIYYNTSAAGGDNFVLGAYTNCCTTPLPAGSGNITNEPLFIDDFDFPANFHLQSNSPCIDAGNSALAPGPKDLDGRPRIIGPKVDIGAYEFQGTATNDFLTWLWNYYLPTDISSDFADSDGDGVNNWQEWKAGTIPVDPSSFLHLVSLQVFPSSAGIGWASVTTRKYSIERSTNLVASPPFTNIATNIPGQSNATFFTDTNATGRGPFFYRVRVE